MPGIRLAELHPIIVHFPIALLITSVVMDVLAIVLKRTHLVYGATWLLGFGVLGALAAGLTGSISEHAAHTDAVRQILSMHQTLGFATGFIFAVLLAARLVWLAPAILGALSAQFPVAGSLERSLKVQLPALYTARMTPALVGVYLFGSVVGVILLGLTGYLGGAMVYDHGVGTPTGLLLNIIQSW